MLTFILTMSAKYYDWLNLMFNSTKFILALAIIGGIIGFIIIQIAETGLNIVADFFISLLVGLIAFLGIMLFLVLFPFIANALPIFLVFALLSWLIKDIKKKLSKESQPSPNKDNRPVWEKNFDLERKYNEMIINIWYDMKRDNPTIEYSTVKEHVLKTIKARGLDNS